MCRFRFSTLLFTFLVCCETLLFPGYTTAGEFTPLSKFDALRESSSNPYISNTIHALLKQQQHYQREQTQLWRYPVILNLNHYLTKLTEDLNYLVVIENFKMVNLIQWRIPVITRKPVPVVNRINLGWDSTYEVWLGASTMNFKNASIRSACPLSKFLEELCLTLNRRELSLHSKPFNGYIHMGIYPPKPAVGQWGYGQVYPKIFLFTQAPTMRHMIAPSLISPVNIVIKTQEDNDSLVSFHKWVLDT